VVREKQGPRKAQVKGKRKKVKVASPARTLAARNPGSRKTGKENRTCHFAIRVAEARSDL
jgi:hypothetical protein